jgi:ABC-2 type transport system permease protein
VASASPATAEWYARMGGSEQIVDAYRASVMEMAGMAVAVYVVQILLRVRAEEADGRLEPLLSTAVSRSRWIIGHLVNAGLGALALLSIFAAGMALAAGAALGDVPAQLREMLPAGLVQLPAIMVLGGVVVAATALVPHWSAAVSWSGLLLAILVGPLFGAATLQLPQWAQDISPFTHVPKLPAADVSVFPLLALLGVSVVLAGVAVAWLRRRDLALPA